MYYYGLARLVAFMPRCMTRLRLFALVSLDFCLSGLSRLRGCGLVLRPWKLDLQAQRRAAITNQHHSIIDHAINIYLI